MSDRVIKFRCWDKGKGVMIYSDSEDNQFLVNLDGFVEGYDDDDGGKGGMWEHAYKVDVVLLQFTGLLDKNGKEIYEGDIFKWFSRKCDSTEQWENIAEVKFKNGQFACKVERKLSYECAYLFADEFRYFEVIGNIYENPELLEVK
jgi:uncharacterized phage protein (TIGR01671 family)